jgi:hypothetical protein
MVNKKSPVNIFLPRKSSLDKGYAANRVRIILIKAPQTV